MPKQAKLSFFDLIYVIRVVGNGMRMYLSMPKQCQSMSKQAKMSFFDLIYKIRILDNGMKMYLNMPKQTTLCQSMPKQAKK